MQQDILNSNSNYIHKVKPDLITFVTKIEALLQKLKRCQHDVYVFS